MNQTWTRREWMTRTLSAAMTIPSLPSLARLPAKTTKTRSPGAPTLDVSVSDLESLMQHAVSVARQSGAQYADARATRVEYHSYRFDGSRDIGDIEMVGVGVRVLAHGAWGFAACPHTDMTGIEQITRAAIDQAAVNAQGIRTRPVTMEPIPGVRGKWTTPVSLDPFIIAIEEKHTFMDYWSECARKVGLDINPMASHLSFSRQQRVTATSDGTCVTQMMIESGGKIIVERFNPQDPFQVGGSVPVQGIETAGRGWELLLDAHIPEQIALMPDRITASIALQRNAHPATVGRYTLVCDGATMASLVGATLGVATQLDRALGDEANAGGTSLLSDPLGMVRTFQVGSPFVNVSANRSAPGQLATVKWDDEGVIPPEITLVKNGIVHDFQTTREQAAWLASYYQKIGQPVRSNGCAAAESALAITMQHMPNLALLPNATAVSLEDLTADVSSGILIEAGEVPQMDAQARNGLLVGRMRKIQNGRLGPMLIGGAIQFNTLELWKNVIAVGGPSTQQIVSSSQYPYGSALAQFAGRSLVKGEPPQLTSHSVQAVAATIANQPVIDPAKRA